MPLLPNLQDDLAVMARQPGVEGQTLYVCITIDHDAVRSLGKTLQRYDIRMIKESRASRQIPSIAPGGSSIV